MTGNMRDLFKALQSDSARMAGHVQQAVSDAAEAIVRGDADRAQAAIDVDDKVDAAELRVEKSAIDLLSLYRPLAGEFRTALMTLKANGELERIADCAGNVAGQVNSLLADAERAGVAYSISSALAGLATATDDIVRRTVRAYNFADPDVAEQVIQGDARIDALYEQVLQESAAELRSPSDRRERQLAFIMAAKNLERIGDHCTNVAEDILYIVRGELVRHRHAV